MTLLTMTLSGGLFILAVLGVRAVFGHIVPRRTFLILWMVAVALLLIPLRLPAPVSIYQLAGHRDAASVMRAVVPAAPLPARVPRWKIAWIAGGGLLLAAVLTVHVRNLLRFRRAVPLETHPAGIPARVRVKTLKGLPSPMVYGIVRPTILLCAEDDYTPEQLRHICLHELCHIRHLDVLRRYLTLLTLAVHWFNPLVWIMFYCSVQDMEMRCDEQAIRALGAKKPYCTTLVMMETGKLQHMLEPGFSFSATGSRLRAIIKAKRLPVISLVLALGLCVCTIAVFATDGRAQRQISEAPPAAAPAAPTPAPVPTPEEAPEPEPAPEAQVPEDLPPEPSETPEEPAEESSPPAAAPSEPAPSAPAQESPETVAAQAYSIPLPNGATASVPAPELPAPEPEIETLTLEEVDTGSSAGSEGDFSNAGDFMKQIQEKYYQENEALIREVQNARAAESASQTQSHGPTSAMPDPYPHIPTSDDFPGPNPNPPSPGVTWENGFPVIYIG